MSDEKGLLAAIWEHPHDDTPRLVYADWLDEHGQSDRAEFVRVQCELAAADGDDPRLDGLEAREAELSGRCERGWWAAMPAGARRGHFDRGFPVPTLERFRIPDLVRLGEARLRAAPLWRYRYNVHGDDLAPLLAWPMVRRLRLFALRPPLPGGWASDLARCEGLGNVADLSLIECTVRPGDLRVLLDAWRGRRLDRLRFNPSPLGGEGLGLLASHPTASEVRELVLEGYAHPPTPAAEAICAAPGLSRLRGLALETCGVRGDSLDRLLTWPGLRRLRGLSLANNLLAGADAERLAGCGALTNLRWLSLGDNVIGAAGAEALAASPHLGRLRRFQLHGNPLTKSHGAVQLLRDRFGEAVTTTPLDVCTRPTGSGL